MKEKTNKILALIDLKKSTDSVIKNSLSLAENLNADVHFFHVKKPTDVVTKANQLTAIRTINEESNKLDKELKTLLNPHIENNKFKISFSYSIGNIKNELERFLDKNTQNIVVLGKRKTGSFRLVGDNVTNYVLDKHPESVIISAEDSVIEPSSNLSLGFLNSKAEDLNEGLTKELVNLTKEPLNSFRVIDSEEDSKEKIKISDKKTVEYVFEKNDDSIHNISNYLLKNKVNLLCINRTRKMNKNVSKLKNEIKEVINKTNISILLTT